MPLNTEVSLKHCRVGFDGRALVSPAAGVRRYARELFRALADAGWPRIVAVGAPEGVVLPEGIERAAGAATLPTNAGWMVTGLPRASRRARLDLFHAPSYTTPLWGPRPLVLTIHDVSYERRPEWYPYRRDPARRAFYRWSARTADRIITDSQFSKNEIVAAYGVDPTRVHVVPLAAASSFTAGPRLPLPRGLPIRYVLHVGDLHVRRNLDVVVRAVSSMRTRRADLRDIALVLAGVDRGEAAELRASARRAGGQDAIVCMGSVDEATLIALYRSAIALVYPSRYEGFGLPILEAMASGLPVIAAATSSIPEVVGDAGLLLDPDDEEAWTAALTRLVDEPAWAADRRAAGLSRCADFSWDRTAAGTVRVYEAALSRSA